MVFGNFEKRICSDCNKLSHNSESKRKFTSNEQHTHYFCDDCCESSDLFVICRFCNFKVAKTDLKLDDFAWNEPVSFSEEERLDYQCPSHSLKKFDSFCADSTCQKKEKRACMVCRNQDHNNCNSELMISFQKLTSQGVIEVGNALIMIKLAVANLDNCGISLIGLGQVEKMVTKELENCQSCAFVVSNLCHFAILVDKKSITLKPKITLAAENLMTKIIKLELKPNDLSSLESVKNAIVESQFANDLRASKLFFETKNSESQMQPNFISNSIATSLKNAFYQKVMYKFSDSFQSVRKNIPTKFRELSTKTQVFTDGLEEKLQHNQIKRVYLLTALILVLIVCVFFSFFNFVQIRNLQTELAQTRHDYHKKHEQKINSVIDLFKSASDDIKYIESEQQSQTLRFEAYQKAIDGHNRMFANLNFVVADLNEISRNSYWESHDSALLKRKNHEKMFLNKELLKQIDPTIMIDYEYRRNELPR